MLMSASPGPGPTLLQMGTQIREHLSTEQILQDDHLQRLRSDIDGRTRRLEQEKRHLRDLEDGVAKCKREYEARRVRYQKLKQAWEGKQGVLKNIYISMIDIPSKFIKYLVIFPDPWLFALLSVFFFSLLLEDKILNAHERPE